MRFTYEEVFRDLQEACLVILGVVAVERWKPSPQKR